MNSKVANLIVVELAVLIAIMAWLAFSNLQGVKPQEIAQEPARMVDSFSGDAPGRLSANRRRRPALDYRADLAAGQEQEEQPAQTQEYEQAIATEPYTSPALDDGYLAETSPYYDVVEPEPLFTSPDCLLSPIDQFVVYPQSSAIIVFSNSRSSGRRPRFPARLGHARTMVAHRRPPVVGPSHVRDVRGAPRTAHLQPFRSNSRVRPRQIP